MKKQGKNFSDLTSIDDFLEFYKDAKKSELSNRLKTLGTNHLTKMLDNERKAIKALLA